MNPPQAVVFDLGKVLLDFDYSLAAGKLEPRSKLLALDFRTVIDQSPLLLRYETGLLSTEEFFEEVQKRSGYSGDLSEFGAAFGDIFRPIEPMVQLQATLRDLGLRTYAFSNTNELAVRHIRGRFPFFSLFDGCILSYEHRAMKPDPRLYAVVEELTGNRGADLLYIDDRAENIAAGADRGWRTILHETPSATIEAVRRSGLQV